MQNRVIEITYMFWERFFVMENRQCHFICYPMTRQTDLKQLKGANNA